MTEFTKFSAAATAWCFIAGFIYTGGLFFAYNHSHNAPAFLQGIVTGFEILVLVFGASTALGLTFVVSRFIGRTIGEYAFRKIFG